jgi:hypothetical protein
MFYPVAANFGSPQTIDKKQLHRGKAAQWGEISYSDKEGGNISWHYIKERPKFCEIPVSFVLA